jgi:hypothetical protein
MRLAALTMTRASRAVHLLHSAAQPHVIGRDATVMA